MATAKVTESRRPTTAVPLILIALCALVRPAFVVYTQHVDDRYAEEPLSTLLMIGLVAPFVVVLAAILMLLVAQRWTTVEIVALPLLLAAWLMPIFVAPLSFGCSDVGGVAEPCGVTSVSTTREIIVLVIAAAVAAAVVWLCRRPAKIEAGG